MDTAQWPQDIVVKPMDEIVVTNSGVGVGGGGGVTKAPTAAVGGLERKIRPQKEQALNCPRCNSTNTKFCYYNNYSLSQPRYFCKTCRRYWTEGGSLRNIPVGGGSRKNKKTSSTSTTTTTSTTSTNSIISSKKHLPELVIPPHLQLPTSKMHHESQDLNLGFSTTTSTSNTHDFKTISELIQVPNYDTNNKALELLNGIGGISNTNNNTSNTTSISCSRDSLIMPIMPITDPNTTVGAAYTSSGFPLPPEFIKPSLSFSLDGTNFGSFQEPSCGKQLLFPFEDLKQVTSNTTSDHHDHGGEHNRDNQQHGDSTGYWSGVIGGGSW